MKSNVKITLMSSTPKDSNIYYNSYQSFNTFPSEDCMDGTNEDTDAYDVDKDDDDFKNGTFLEEKEMHQH